MRHSDGLGPDSERRRLSRRTHATTSCFVRAALVLRIRVRAGRLDLSRASTLNHLPTSLDSGRIPRGPAHARPDPRHPASRRRREQQHTGKCDGLPCLLQPATRCISRECNTIRRFRCQVLRLRTSPPVSGGRYGIELGAARFQMDYGVAQLAGIGPRKKAKKIVHQPGRRRSQRGQRHNQISWQAGAR